MYGTDHSGEVLDGRYRLIGKIAQGGMGSIYLARHLTVGRDVAIKVLHAEFVSSEVVVTRFYREAEAAASIRHRNIVDVFDLGVTAWGEPYIAMEYLEGESVGTLLERRGTVDLAAALGIAEPALSALGAAHAAGVVHRDLKPENIFLARSGSGPPVVKLIDFGIAKLARYEEKARLTRAGALLGTLEYMSPEQARGLEDTDHRADIFSVGVVLYQMLTGTFPFAGSSYSETFLNILTLPPRPPTAVCPAFPAGVEPIVMKALSKDPADRYQSAAEMLEALKTLPEFGERKRALAAIAEGAVPSGFAVGDLGENTVTDISGVASEIRARIGRGRTPGVWSRATERLGRRRTPLAMLVGGLIAAAIVAAIVGTRKAHRDSLAVLARADRAPAAARSDGGPGEAGESPVAGKDQGVLIEVKGAPDDARILFGEALVGENPFRVERRETIVPLRVEAPGHEPVTVAVTPSRDQTVEIAMEKKPEKARPGSAQVAASPLKAAPAEGLDRSRQAAVIKRNRNDLKQCYDAALRAGDVQPGEDLPTEFQLSVSESGMVMGVAVMGGAARVPPFSRCLQTAVKTWIFPPSSAETSVRFEFLFTTRTE